MSHEYDCPGCGQNVFDRPCPHCRIRELEAEVERLRGSIAVSRDMQLVQACNAPTRQQMREHTLAASLLDELLPEDRRHPEGAPATPPEESHE